MKVFTVIYLRDIGGLFLLSLPNVSNDIRSVLFLLGKTREKKKVEGKCDRGFSLSLSLSVLVHFPRHLTYVKMTVATNAL